MKRGNPDKFFQNNFSRTPGQNIDVLVKKAQPGRPTRKPGAFNNSGYHEEAQAVLSLTAA